MAAAPAAHSPPTAGSIEPRRITAKECFSDMCSMLGGLNEEQNVGYAGQWVTWDVSPAAAEAAGTPGPLLIDTSINIRLWRIVDAASSTVQQSNLYQTPDKMAGPSTRFAAYLAGNTMSGRPDGYGLRVWNFHPTSDMVNVGKQAWGVNRLKPDGSVWRMQPGSAEGAMRVLTVPGAATTIINGSMPSSFDDGHMPRFWVLEFIIKESGSAARRWASMNWYELGELVVDRSINEDVYTLPGQLDDLFVDPSSITFQPRREGTFAEDIEAWVSANGFNKQQGSATVFAYDRDLQLTVSSCSCTWSSEVVALAADEAAGGIQQQAYPDWSYCRVPKNLKSLVASGKHRAVFEAGTLLRDGSLARWLLEYSTGGDRLLKSAVFEIYPPTKPHSG
eukprot:gene7230-7443_t